VALRAQDEPVDTKLDIRECDGYTDMRRYAEQLLQERDEARRELEVERNHAVAQTAHHQSDVQRLQQALAEATALLNRWANGECGLILDETDAFLARINAKVQP
jgi:hypothetical protein